MLSPTPFNTLRSLFGVVSPGSDISGTDPWNFEGDKTIAEDYYSSLELKKGIRPDYDFYDDMDEDEIIGSVLDAYAEDSTQVNYENGKTVWPESTNDSIVEIIEELFDDIVLEEIVFSLIRDIAKQGNDFEGAVGGFDQGVIGLDPKDPRKIKRVDHIGKLKGFEIEGSRESLPPWAIVHFRLLSRNRKSPYGDSILWNARKIYRKIKWIEDAIILYRLRRAPDRTIWYIDTNNVGPQEQLRLANKWRKTIKKNIARTPEGLKQDLRLMAADTDIFFPKNRDSQSNVEHLAGSANVGDIWDLEYFLNKLFGSLRAPKGYFGFEGEIDAKASLVQQDFKFARGCVKLQRALLIGLSQLVQIHLAYKRIDPLREENAFILRMSPVSFLEEQFRQEITSLRIDTVDRLLDMGEKLGFKKAIWIDHVLMQFGGFSQPEIDKFREEEKVEQLEKLTKTEVFKNRLKDQLFEAIGAVDSRNLRTSYHIPRR